MKCKKCGGCCKHVAIEIDKPKTKEDHNDILWYLLHENVKVFIEEKEWFIEFKAKCKALDEENNCKFYEERPKICRAYDSEECVNNGEDDEDYVEFNSADEFLEYMKKQGIDYKYKNWK